MTNPAVEQMRALNPRALIGQEDDAVVAIEDVTDPDGRMYRLEYRVTPDAQHAIAFCLYNPWGGAQSPSAGAAYPVAHVAPDGFLCLGHGSERQLAQSPFALDFAVHRARFWCTAFSVLKETGRFPNP